MQRHILDTTRLSIREFGPADGPFVRELVNEPGWLENIGDRHIHDDAAAVGYIEAQYPNYEAHGFGMWRAAIAATDEPIGMCGLLKRETLDAPDIGFAFLARVHGQGYAAEAARGVLRWAKAHGHERLLAFTKPSNEPSARLLAAIGFTETRRVTMPGQTEESRLFEWRG